MFRLSDQEIIDISENYLRGRIESLIGFEIPNLESVLIIGSAVVPETIRRKSDLDLIFVLDDVCTGISKQFKYGYQTALKNGCLPVDVLIYSVSSFDQELCWGSLTRTFAVLNAYKVLHSLNGKVEIILENAEERIRLSIEELKKHLASLDIAEEMKNLQNYFGIALSVLSSEKTRDNYLLVELRFIEFLKEMLIQYKQCLYASDIQSGLNNEQLNVCIRNFLIFRNYDGTRLLDPNKYYVDPRVFLLHNTLNEIIRTSKNQSECIQRIFAETNISFQRDVGYPLFIKNGIQEYFKAYKIKNLL